MGGWFNDIIEWFKSVGSWFWELPGRIWEFFSEGLKALFIPSDDYFSGQNNNLKALLEGKLNATQYINIFKSFQNIVGSVPPNITIDLYGQTLTIIDFQYVAKCLPTFHFLVRGLVFIYLIWFNYNQIINLIRGNHPLQSGSASSGPSVIYSGGQLTEGSHNDN